MSFKSVPIKKIFKQKRSLYKMGKSLGILSLKGGVGKTSTVIALGAAIANFGKKVALVDANFSSPNLGIHLNIIHPEVTLHHVLSRKANITSAIHKLDKFDVIPSSLFYNLKINLFKLKDRIKTLRRNYDYILIDSSPAFNDETLAAMLASDELLAVTTPDYATLSSTIKAIKLAKRRGTPIKGLILNKVHNKNFELSLEDIERTAEVPVLAVIPHDINILKAQSEFVPSTTFSPKSVASEEYKKLAASIVGERYKPINLKTIFGWINPPKQAINREIFYKRVFKD